jgi:1,4-alpha-glucan branching enzyme
LLQHICFCLKFQCCSWAKSGAPPSPFPSFCDFEGELGDLVRTGRRDEFKAFPAFHDPEQREKIPDPQAEHTFLLGKIDWEQRDYGIHNDWFRWYKKILAVRKEDIVPLLPQIKSSATFEIRGEGAVDVVWQAGNQKLRLSANPSGERVDGFPGDSGRTLWQEAPNCEGTVNRPWSVRWAVIDE